MSLVSQLSKISLALLLAVASGLLASSVQAASIDIRDGSYAAIAYSPSLRKVNYCIDADSKEEAEAVALKACGAKDAVIAVWVCQGFCSIALGDDSSEYGFGFCFDGGANTEWARNDALRDCQKKTTNCRIVLTISSDGQSIHDRRAYDQGEWLASKGEADKALARFDDAVRKNHNDAQAYYARARIYELKKNYAQVIANLNECIRILPSEASLYRARGDFYAMLGDKIRAESDHAEAARLDPQNKGIVPNQAAPRAKVQLEATPGPNRGSSLTLNPERKPQTYAEAFRLVIP